MHHISNTVTKLPELRRVRVILHPPKQSDKAIHIPDEHDEGFVFISYYFILFNM